MIRVKATREGLIGGHTATGYVIDNVVPFVALPCEQARERFLRISNPLNLRSCYAIVLEVGPWNTNDLAYVFEGARPLAESQPQTNGAGIDLGEKVWSLLRMEDNTDVEWEFLP